MGALANIGRVVYATDLHEGARAALPYATYFAALTGAELRTLHVAPPGDGVSGSDLPGPEAAWRRVSGWIGQPPGPGDGEVSSADVPDARREVRESDDPAEAILGYADEVGAGLLCLGTHARRGLRRLVLGSVAERVVRESPAPVLTVRRGVGGWGEQGLARILVPVDLSGMMPPALAWSARVAAAAGAALRVVHVVESPAGAAATGRRQRIYAAYHEHTRPEARPDERPEVEILAGDPAGRICGCADEEGADLIVTATHGRSGPARLVLGSVTEAVVRRAPCPVLTVTEPPPGG